MYISNLCDIMIQMVREGVIMEIQKLDPGAYSGKLFTVQYMTPGYYEIKPEDFGFSVQYCRFPASVSRSFSDSFFSDWLECPAAYGVFEEDQLLGFVEGSMETWNNRFRISNLCVFSEEYRRHGIGSLLMNQILTEAKAAGARMAVLETQSCNIPAISFYKRHGFTVIGFDLFSYTNDDPQHHEVRIEMGRRLEGCP